MFQASFFFFAMDSESDVISEPKMNGTKVIAEVRGHSNNT